MKFLLINGGHCFAHSNGELNAFMHKIAKTTLERFGHEIKETNVTAGYDCEEEVEKYLWSDVVIYQNPGWWMGLPWSMKKYIDDVFTAGHGRIYRSDGRKQANPTRNYGTGGLLHGKKYMLSLTWNAPIEAFDLEDEFFEGKGVDGVYFAFHKCQQFVGFEKMDTFIINDVMKNPQIEEYEKAYEQHLIKHFSKNE